MRNFIIIAIIFLLFGGCTTHKKLLKNQSELKIENHIESTNEIVEESKAVKLGKTNVVESSTVEEISIKKPVNIELTANFRIDSTATLRGDTALKLVDVSDKNVSVTIYQNGKNGQLTAKIKSKNSVEDVPFSEISIKKSTTNKAINIDTSKIDSSKVLVKATLKDKSKVKASKSKVEKDVQKANYLFMISFVVLVVCLLAFLFKR
ncbi:hypothetical protein [Pedobacter sp. N23S346]|uniref:hypothetical protein n=1 Tax=Pedobacter sp. N23S346 TaxID=3402750 RepID=UPI003ACCEE8D